MLLYVLVLKKWFLKWLPSDCKKCPSLETDQYLARPVRLNYCSAFRTHGWKSNLPGHQQKRGRGRAPVPTGHAWPELEFLKSLWGLEIEEEEGYSTATGPPGYIGWRNSFLGIDSGATYTFKNTGSVSAFGRYVAVLRPRRKLYCTSAQHYFISYRSSCIYVQLCTRAFHLQHGTRIRKKTTFYGCQKDCPPLFLSGNKAKMLPSFPLS
jgi:hypothetical protein